MRSLPQRGNTHALPAGELVSTRRCATAAAALELVRGIDGRCAGPIACSPLCLRGLVQPSRFVAYLALTQLWLATADWTAVEARQSSSTTAGSSAPSHAR